MTRPIFINGRFLAQPISGQQRYAREIVTHIDQLLRERPSQMRWTILTPPGADRLQLETIEQRVIGRLYGHAWDQLSFLRRSARGVALSLSAAGPILHPRQIVVIHDAAVYRHPEHFSRAYGTLHRTMDRILARTATIATVSEFSRQELSAILGLPANRILLAPNGCDHLVTAPDPDIIHRLGLGGTPFFLVLGNLTRNKNLAQAVRALTLLPSGSAKLVAVGALNAKLFGEAGLPQSDDLILPGRLSDAEVVGLMRRARALIFPSIYEGFGIPPLEAMVNGCPVLASRIPAVQEVCGDAAAYFDLFDDSALATLMTRAIAHEDWRKAMVAAGATRTAIYRWDTPAQTLIDAAMALANR